MPAKPAMPAMPDLTVKPLTATRWPDLEAIFLARGCSIPRGCWCMYYRESGNSPVPRGLTPPQARKQRLRELVGGKVPPGLIAYQGKTPVGWISLGPREDFAKLARSPVMKPVDDAAVWSIVCFVVPSEYRHQGVAHALLEGAIAWCAKRGVRLLEAYPVDKARRGADEWMWFGAKSMFDRAGFTEVARRKPERPIVRLHLAEG